MRVFKNSKAEQKPKQTKNKTKQSKNKNRRLP
jgi:hypothetical protein